MTTLNEHLHQYKKGDILFRQGDPGGVMFVIQKGQIEISRKVGEREHVLAVLPEGEFFGEMSILNNAPRSATAKVVSDAILLEIDSNTLSTMVKESSEIAVRMLKNMAFRLEQTTAQMELLMYRDPNSRVVHRLRQLAEQSGRAVPEGIAVDVSYEALAEHLGLSVMEVSDVALRLERAKIAQRVDESFILSEVGKLQDFLDFIELKERYGE